MKLYEIINESNWCKDKTAVLKDGTPTHSKDPNAVKRCFLAWFLYHYNIKIDDEHLFKESYPIIKYLGVEFCHEIMNWNDDENTHIKDVIKLCKDLNI